MQTLRKPSALLLGAGFLALSSFAAEAAAVTISGSTPASFPGYGNQVQQNNVVNYAPVTDATNGALYYGSTGGNPAVVSYTGGGTYSVDWYFLGAESGFTNTFNAPGVSFSEANQNNAFNGGAITAPSLVGTSTNQTSTTLNFSVTVQGQGVTQNNGASNPVPGQGVANFVFAYLAQVGNSLSWQITSIPSEWFLIGWNDNGGPDDNHDDIMMIGRLNASPVPIPAALPLFAGGLGLLGWLARRKKRAAAAAV